MQIQLVLEPALVKLAYEPRQSKNPKQKRKWFALKRKCFRSPIAMIQTESLNFASNLSEEEDQTSPQIQARRREKQTAESFQKTEVFHIFLLCIAQFQTLFFGGRKKRGGGGVEEMGSGRNRKTCPKALKCGKKSGDFPTVWFQLGAPVFIFKMSTFRNTFSSSLKFFLILGKGYLLQISSGVW